jgi:hypothetical protein
MRGFVIAAIALLSSALICSEAEAQRPSRRQLSALVEQLTERIELLEKSLDSCVVKSMPTDPTWDKW